jgi:hypothetical protein
VLISMLRAFITLFFAFLLMGEPSTAAEQMGGIEALEHCWSRIKDRSLLLEQRQDLAISAFMMVATGVALNYNR